MTKCFAQMREDHAELMKKIKSRKDRKKDCKLRRRIAMHPIAAIVTPAEKEAPMILVIVVKM